MKPAPFDYFAPISVEETCSLLAHYGDNAKISGRRTEFGTSSCSTPGATRSSDRHQPGA